MPKRAMSPSSSSSSPTASPRRFAVVFFPALLLLFLLLFGFLHLFLTQNRTTATTNTICSPPPNPYHLRILVAVLTFTERYELRHLLRLVNSRQPPVPNAHIDVKFVVCALTRDDQKVLVGLEILRYDDMMIIDCKENGNSGKTHVFFSTLAKAFANTTACRNKPYDYVMKADDDTYVRFPALVETLRPLPRDDVYFGYMVPAGKNHEGDPMFMKGMGYALSWDVVEAIGKEESIRNNTLGPEDKLVGAWLRDMGKGRNVHDTSPSEEGGETKAVQYDLPWMSPNTISVHRIKDRVKWAAVLAYFNVTAGVTMSKFHNIY